jgi:methyltransferase-like protein
MAYQYPESTFEGLDLSTRAVEEGTKLSAELDLRNVTLVHQDIMDVGSCAQPYDYIIVHGVYSWVPAPVRTRIMELMADNLAPQGVGYVSYNCLPRCHIRNIGRDVMRFHVREIADPRERVRQARAIISVMSGMAAGESDLYTYVLRDLAHYADQRPDEVLYHDDLAEIATPFLFQDVMREAAATGLQYLCEASSPEVEGLSDAAQDFLCRFPSDDVVQREQYRDFITGRGFRETLLCRETVAINHKIDPRQTKAYLVSAPIRPVDDPADPAAEGRLEFRSHGGVKVVTDHPLSKAALLHLARIWPQELTFNELARRSVDDLGEASSRVAADREAELDALATTIYSGFSVQAVVLRSSPAPFTVAITARPKASHLARQQAAAGEPVTTMAHGTVALQDPLVCQFLQLLDGTRTVDDIAGDLRLRMAEAGDAPADGAPEHAAEPDPVTREQVERNLHLVAKMALLIA